MEAQARIEATIHAALSKTLPLPLLIVISFCLATSPRWQASALIFALSVLANGALSAAQLWAVRNDRAIPHGFLRAALECATGCAMAWSTGAAGTGWVIVLPSILSLPLVLPGWRSSTVLVGMAALLPAVSLASGAPTMAAATAAVVLGVVASAHASLVWVLQTHYGAALQDVQAANRAKSSFIAHVSHEIRTPLNGLLGAQQLLQQGPLEPEQAQLVSVSLRSGSALLDVLNAVLDLSKIEAGGLELEQRPLQPRVLLTDAADSLQTIAAGKGLALRTLIDPDMPAWLCGDPTRLRQIVLNLLSNALKFTTSGSVVVSARWDAGTLRVAVTDTGIGIPPERRDAIFEPFVQADASTTRRFGGTGLGLSLVQQLVAQMGGQIGVESTPGEGSTFWVTLPAVVHHPVSQAVAPVRSKGPPRRVLVVEDNAINQIIARRMLEQEGHTVLVACDGQEVLDRWEQLTVEVVLMDCQMPRLDGLQTTRALRDLGVTIPIIALTANAFIEDRRACLAAGMDDFLSKPLQRDALRQALGTLRRPPWASAAAVAVGR